MAPALHVSLAEEQAQSRTGVVGDTALLLSCSMQALSVLSPMSCRLAGTAWWGPSWIDTDDARAMTGIAVLALRGDQLWNNYRRKYLRSRKRKRKRQ